MTRVHKLLRLPSENRRLLAKSMVMLWVIRVGLWVLSFRTLIRLISGMTRTPPKSQAENEDVTARVIWAVTAAGRFVPASTCLTEALATQVLLSQCGQPACLRIGVAKDEGGRLEAHAWVESQGRIVIGSVANLSRFTLLPPLDAGGP